MACGTPCVSLSVRAFSNFDSFSLKWRIKARFASGTDHLTLADLAYLATTSTLVATGMIADLPPELDQWYNKCKSLIPDYEKANGLGAEEFGQGFKNKGFFK